MQESDFVRKCGVGFDLVQWGPDEVCLRFEFSFRPWFEAVSHCEALGADLVHIFDESQQAAFTGYLKNQIDAVF